MKFPVSSSGRPRKTCRTGCSRRSIHKRRITGKHQTARAPEDIRSGHFPFPVLWFNPGDLSVIDGNTAAERITGYNLRDLRRTFLGELLATNDCYGEYLKRVAKGKSGLSGYHGHKAVLTGNGIFRHIRLYCIPPGKNAQQDVPIPVIIVDDEDLFKELEFIKKANTKLNLLNGIMRHDIMNSLTTAGAYYSMLKENPEGKWTEDQNHLLNRMYSELETIGERIRFSNYYENIGVNHPVWLNVEKSMQAGMKSDIRLFSSVTGLEIYADPQTELVFFCLVDNALRHGKQVTEISLTCRCNDLGCTLSIQDNGIGIEPGEKTLIFERGYGKNTGYGLFLARQILDLNNMTIHETGGFGQGARFDIDIPAGSFRVV
jgi:nitrogen-specific signal transduction histidine kinase